MPKPTTIAQYIRAAPEAARAHLDAMLGCLREAAPGAEESIKWGAPTLSYKRILFSFAAYRSHISLYPTPAALRHFANRLSGYRISKSTIHFPFDEPLPLSLIREIADFRVRDCIENDARWM